MMGTNYNSEEVDDLHSKIAEWEDKEQGHEKVINTKDFKAKKAKVKEE